ncbi:uncharacterized protein LOC132554016 isoform X2 [Ylistrum balloti]|uniref:uncharacterized protein LOC132554016 isoform X2 n=1 Tax=Ylistrum balloti TaxID=509963 RepID=UPI002905BFDC|nr:uncharacterized protein LOC132554016 isoform X2 [Ylistrum balloti]
MAEKNDPKGWVEGLEIFPPGEEEQPESSSSSEGIPEPESNPVSGEVLELESTFSPSDCLPPVYELPMSPPPTYEEAKNHSPEAAIYQPRFEPKNITRPKRKDLYRDAVMPEEEVELQQMRPRRIPYEEEAPIDDGPTREVYKESSLDAALSLDPKDQHRFPQVVPDSDIEELPPGQEDKATPQLSLSFSNETSTPVADVEAGRRREKTSETFQCNSCGFLNSVVTSLGRFFLRRTEEAREGSPARLLILIGAIIGFLGLIVFLGVFPNSFVYVEHYEIALLKNTYTGTVYRDYTYHPGCYVLGPQREFVKFPGSAVFVSLTEDVFTKDKLEISITFHFQYFLRASELGELHRKFGLDYKDIVKSVVRSKVKNFAADISLDDFRFNRTETEKRFCKTIQVRLQGTCCPECCPSCSNKTICNLCDTTSMCDPIYHVDIRYFQLSTVYIASDISERYLRSLLLKVRAEAEFFKQNHTMIEKETERMVEQKKNEANELIKGGEATSSATMLVAEAKREANITTGYAVALWTLYYRLGITDMDHKLSLMMVRAFEDVNVKGNLYRGYNYANQTIATNFGSG